MEVLEISADVKEELVSTGLLGIFLNLAPSHQNEYLKWINEAKKEETRISRIAKMCEMLQAGVESSNN